MNRFKKISCVTIDWIQSHRFRALNMVSLSYIEAGARTRGQTPLQGLASYIAWSQSCFCKFWHLRQLVFNVLLRETSKPKPLNHISFSQ